jgi:hypothetical protein
MSTATLIAKQREREKIMKYLELTKELPSIPDTLY